LAPSPKYFVGTAARLATPKQPNTGWPCQQDADTVDRLVIVEEDVDAPPLGKSGPPHLKSQNFSKSQNPLSKSFRQWKGHHLD
jgi:hypothetical protein